MKRPLLLLGSLVLTGSLLRADDLAIIVAKDVPLDDVALPDLVKIFRCEKTTAPDGTRLTIVTREKGSAERAAALAGIYKFSDAAFEKYFMQQVFTGSVAAAPRIVASVPGLKKLAASAPGTIGYVRASDVDDSVKVVKIDGLAPGAPGYALKVN
jgi:phosphate transport system substrate-binding protein